MLVHSQQNLRGGRDAVPGNFTSNNGEASKQEGVLMVCIHRAEM